jgi:hypothetical protein
MILPPEYREHPGLNASALKKGRKSMLHMRHYILSTDDTQTPSMRAGGLIHLALLQYDCLEKVTAIYDKTKRGADWESFKALHPDVEIIKTREWDMMNRARDRMVEDLRVFSLIEDSKREVAIYWEDEFLGKCKALLDCDGPRGVVELKTTGQIEHRRYMSNSFNQGTHMQLGWYEHGRRAAGGKDVPFWVVVIEQSEPFDMAVYSVRKTILDQGYEECEEIGRRYRICETTGRFPGTSQDIQEYELPAWATGNAMDKLDLTGVEGANDE